MDTYDIRISELQRQILHDAMLLYIEKNIASNANA